MLGTFIGCMATDRWADVYGTQNQDSVLRHWRMTTTLYGWSSSSRHIPRISDVLAFGLQLAYQVHAKLPLHTCVNTRLNHPLVEHSNVAVCQDLHGPYKPDVLLVRGLCTRREAYRERK